MSGVMFQLVQGLVLGVVLLASLALAWRKLMPNASRSVLARAAMALDRPGHGVFVRHIGRWLQPAEANAGACGDGAGCGSCRGCAPGSDPQVLPLTIRPRTPRR